MGKDQEFLDAARNGNIIYIEKILSQRTKRTGPLASLRRGPGINVQDSGGGYSALHHACLNGHKDIVRLLLDHEASPNLPDSRGSSPLHLAAWAGEEDIVKILLTHPYKKANPNLQTIENETPLHCAAQHGHIGVLAILLSHNADPNMCNKRGETPLDLAAQYGRLQAVKMLIRAHPEQIVPYSKKMKSRHVSMALSSTPSPSPSSPSPSPSSPSPPTPVRNIYPHTCLHLASRNGHKSVVETLLAAGVHINLLTPSGTALHEAALCGKEPVVRVLLRAGIDLTATDAEGRTVLDVLREFPPHVTKDIVNVINNFRNQIASDDNDEVVYRHHQPSRDQRGNGSNHSNNSNNKYDKPSHNNYYHFNSNNHLLNHSHPIQSYRGGGNCFSYNGDRSFDSNLHPEDDPKYSTDSSSPHQNFLNHCQNEMGVSPSSSMSSFEPPSVSPQARFSTGGIGMADRAPHFTSFGAGGAPPKKPPRRNLSVSPTQKGQQFLFTPPERQSQPPISYRLQQRSSSNDGPYASQSRDSSSGISFDETQFRDRQRSDRLYASAREALRSSKDMPKSSSNDILNEVNYGSDQYQCIDNNASKSDQETKSVSLKRPITEWHNIGMVSKDIIKCENPILRSYNPSRKLKRNRISCSLSITDKDALPRHEDPSIQIPTSPTHYNQPPTPDHPPPSFSQAERTIHERIRPLSQEYKRRSMLMQQQQFMVDIGTSPLKQRSSKRGGPINTTSQVVGEWGSTRSLRSTSLSSSDQSASDGVEEFIGDMPFVGLLKGSTLNQRSKEIPTKAAIEGLYATVNKKSSKPSAIAEGKKQQQKPPVSDEPPKECKHEPNTDEEKQITDGPSSQISVNVDAGDGECKVLVGDRNGDAAKESGSILSPFDAEEARKKISEIIESFGNSILSTNISPTIDPDMDELDMPEERSELAVRLRISGLTHLLSTLILNGYDHYKFVNGVIEENDLEQMQISDKDAQKLMKFIKTLPKAEFVPQSYGTEAPQENKPATSTMTATSTGVKTIEQWLNSISLPEYKESFDKHFYNTIDSVCGVWDVELKTVLEINKIGHRRRILQSVAHMRQINEPKIQGKSPLGENTETNRLPAASRGKEMMGYRKNRPAPPPPPSVLKEDSAPIRAPGELSVGLPANLRTKWRHSASVLLNEHIKYEVYYLGSTVVKELRGTESTRKSIQKLKRDKRSRSHRQWSGRGGSGNGGGGNNHPTRSTNLVCISISHRGVEFVDVVNRRAICEHEIQNINCACQDSDDLSLFAYLTKENGQHFCHVFKVDNADSATEIILTLGQAFEVAYQLALRDSNASTATPPPTKKEQTNAQA